ncbi:MAG: NAD(P)/FAD-dependent oxidoreductase [Massiliimalia sp.]|jgi:glycerol-3-phosphate dehydrogenase
MYDVVIIGAGVCGGAVARELSKYQLKVLCLEKENDVADGTSKANSGIVHAGYDPKPGTKMAKYNVLGNRLIEQLSKDLDIPYKKNGSLVVAFTDEDMKTVEELYRRGVENGVPDLSIISAEKVRELEPNLNSEIKGALWAQSAGVVSPWELAIAQFDNAVENGVELRLERKVTGIKQTESGFAVTADFNGQEEVYEAFSVVNAAGVHSDEICEMVSTPTFHIQPDKGQYFLLDKSQGSLVERVIFQCPSKVGKGVLVSPTVHGNLIVGPDAVEIPEKEDVSTTAEQLAFVKRVAAKTCDKINYRESIRNFAGVRAQSEQEDFVVGPIPESDRFINLGGIKSPGLTASPAIALDVVSMLEHAGLKLEAKKDYNPYRKVIRFKELSDEEKQAVIQKDPRYGKIICRCETVTEGEIVAAIHAPVPARTVDAVKRRCQAGMGRCQGGFCSPRVVDILAREWKVPHESICKDKAGSYILTEKTHKGDPIKGKEE